jgi:hypothetical protein
MQLYDVFIDEFRCKAYIRPSCESNLTTKANLKKMRPFDIGMITHSSTFDQIIQSIKKECIDHSKIQLFFPTNSIRKELKNKFLNAVRS